MDFEKLQDSLASRVKALYKKDHPLSGKVLKAFREVPRHLYVKRFRNYGDDNWVQFSDENANQHLPVIYQDSPLIIWGSNSEFESKQGQKQVSTISQPSFVLRMLDLLDIEEGQSVFELGTASGWNAALLSRLVGPSGKVVTTEIIGELAEQAELRLKNLGIENVRVISGDGADGDRSTKFDRVQFTAGSFDFPTVLLDQTKIGGLALFILKNKGGSDNLYLLKRQEHYFESVYSQPCGFVPMTGKSHIKEMEEKDLDPFLDSHGISKSSIEKSPFWWGVGNKDYFEGQTASLRGYLSLFENYEAFHLPEDKMAFGWYDRESNSLALAKAGELLSYGGIAARQKLMDQLKTWIDLGMPALGALNLKIYRTGDKVAIPENSWVSRRPQSTLVWSLPIG